MSLIEASSVRTQTMADGTLRLTVDIEPRHALDAFTLFRAPGTPMALAALASVPLPEKPKGGNAAKWLAMRCADAAFQAWMFAKLRLMPREEAAAVVVRGMCQVASRADIDNDDDARERFDRLIRKPWANENPSETVSRAC